MELQESSRAQKRRQKVAAQGVERESRIAAELAEAGDSERQLEEGALRELLLPLGYAVRDIQARFWYFTNAISCVRCQIMSEQTVLHRMCSL